jgi:Sel1 repeat
VRCGRCGNDNAESNRFCGMCGAPLVAKTQAAGQASSIPAGNTTPLRGSAPVVPRPAPQVAHRGPTTVATAAAERRPAPLSPPGPQPNSGPVITGPSFLGLNVPATGSGSEPRLDRHRDSSAQHDHFRPSGNSLDYLLEDEEEHKGSGGKWMLVIVALALALAFGYLHWKRGGFDWLNGTDKRAATTPKPDPTPTTSDSVGTPATAATPNPSAAPPTDNSPASVPTNGAAAPDSVTNTTSLPSPSPTASAQTPPASAPKDSSAASETSAGAADSAAKEPSEDAPAAVEKPGTRRPAAAKPTAPKPAAGKLYDPVVEAERYLYGRGVTQDCDHGLRLLKLAAGQSNPKAMISLGALYSTGTCTPRDLPTAYRWFAMALHKQPDNQALQNDLQKLWTQMTPPERQLAIKLSQ